MRKLSILALIGFAIAAPSAGHGQATSAADSLPTPSAGPLRTQPLVIAAEPTVASPIAFAPAPGAELSVRRYSTARLAAGGVIGGGLGLLGGLLVGSLIDQGEECDGDVCDETELVLAPAAGEALGMALGVHLANGGQGSMGTNTLVSATLLTAGVFALSEEGGLLVVVPIGQLAGIISAERARERTRR